MVDKINYSQCWEDSLLLKKALLISNEDIVLSITSGGDNTLSLLFEKPNRVVSIDFNKAQNYLLELKIATAKALDYQEFLEFLGVIESKKRLDLFNEIKKSLSVESRLWWEEHLYLIKGGVINMGRFERFLSSFKSIVLPLVHSKKTIVKFLSVNNLSEQKSFYKERWNNGRWRFLFKIFSSQFVLKLFARQKGAFRHIDDLEVGNIYFKRFEDKAQTNLIKDNYFMHYCLAGRYKLSALPPYLEKEGYDFIRNNQFNLDIVTDNIFSYLKSVPDNYFSKFNLSDIFEFLSEKENDSLWEEIIRTAKPDALIAYWNNLIPRACPQYLSNNVIEDKEAVIDLHKLDKSFFYGSFHVNKIIK